MEVEPGPLQRQLESIPGLDVEAGLRTVGGRTESLARLVRKYAELHSEDANVLQVQLAARDLASAHRLAHSVKGATGFLGLVRIHEVSLRLEVALRSASDAAQIESALAAFSLENAALCEAIRGLDQVGAPRP
jgi:HPt (histidine-containing phosphotransfer) domain-containing protein